MLGILHGYWKLTENKGCEFHILYCTGGHGYLPFGWVCCKVN